MDEHGWIRGARTAMAMKGRIWNLEAIANAARNLDLG
jgi:hypothetical protein